MSLSPVPTETSATGRRPTLPAGLALTGAAITFTSLYLAAGALMPLLVVYKEQWGLPAALLTLTFAVFAIGFLAAVLTLGSLSDHVGRQRLLSPPRSLNSPRRTGKDWARSLAASA